jgi:chemotaxis protein CheC
MSLNSFNDINEIHIDVLREIANIGSGQAASSLSIMLDLPVDIAIPDIGLSDYNTAYEKLGGVEAIMAGTLLMISGDITGMMLLLLPAAAACEFLNRLLLTDIKSYEEIDELGFSAICEMANIMSAAFVRAITDMTELFIDISPPEAALDMLGSIMSVPSIYFADISDKLMYMQNELEIAGETTPVNIILLPDIPSLERLMGSLGIET